MVLEVVEYVGGKILCSATWNGLQVLQGRKWHLDAIYGQALWIYCSKCW